MISFTFLYNLIAKDSLFILFTSKRVEANLDLLCLIFAIFVIFAGYIFSLYLLKFAQSLGMASPVKLPSQCETCSTTPYLKLICARCKSGQYSGL
jgi:predicted cation transporter